jgi:hypothetical protein
MDWLTGAGKGAFLSLSLLKICAVSSHSGPWLQWRKRVRRPESQSLTLTIEVTPLS